MIAKPSGSWAPPDGSPTRLILVRHGETPMTLDRRYSGRGDVDLSELGRVNAAGAARRVATLDGTVDVILTSPLRRCVSTAEAVAEVTGAPVVGRDELVECDFGAWEGLTFAEVRERYPHELDAWLASTAVAPPEGESFQQVGARVRGFVEDVLREYKGKQIVLVSHVSPIKLILADALGAGDSFLHRCFLSAAGVSLLDMYADGGVAVRTVNETAHLRTEV